MADKSKSTFEALMGRTAPGKPGPEIEQPSGPSELELKIKTRRLQTFFRNTVLSSYENRCVLTGIAVTHLLIASHIIPWSENEDRRADPTNGLCLNSLHDKAFDRHLITFDEDFRLIVSSFLRKNDVPEFQSANFAKIEGARLRLPHRFAPDSRALEEHRNAFFA